MPNVAPTSTADDEMLLPMSWMHVHWRGRVPRQPHNSVSAIPNTSPALSMLRAQSHALLGPFSAAPRDHLIALCRDRCSTSFHSQPAGRMGHICGGSPHSVSRLVHGPNHNLIEILSSLENPDNSGENGPKPTSSASWPGFAEAHGSAQAQSPGQVKVGINVGGGYSEAHFLPSPYSSSNIAIIDTLLPVPGDDALPSSVLKKKGKAPLL